MTVRISPAEPGDLPALHGLVLELAEYEKLTDTMTATADDLREALFGKHPLAEALIAVDDNEPNESATVGCAIFFEHYSTFAGRPTLYLEDLFVRESHRGYGTGRRLLRKLAKIAHERGYGRMEWTVLDWNLTAQDFYQRLGATVLPDWRLVRLEAEVIATLAGDGD